MPDEPMFAKLMKEPRDPLSEHSQRTNARTRHVSLHLPEEHVRLINRYYKLLYDDDPRPTRSAIVSAAIEVFDRLLDGERPTALDGTLLDRHLRAETGAETRAHLSTEAPRHQDIKGLQHRGRNGR